MHADVVAARLSGSSCDSTTSLCAGGAFDISSSDTAKVVVKNGFSIQYFTEGSGVSGDYSEPHMINLVLKMC